MFLYTAGTVAGISFLYLLLKKGTPKNLKKQRQMQDEKGSSTGGSYLQSLTEEQKNNIVEIVQACIRKGITNLYSIAAILSVISKETEFKPKTENLNYTANRIKQVFLALSSQATKLEANPQALGNAAYGGKYGNALNEGYKYRGRAYNQLTFKGNYEKFGNLTGVNLVSNPDAANDPKIAAEIAVLFAIEGINSLKGQGKLSAYNSTGINDFKSLTDSLQAFYHINAGTGRKVSTIKALELTDSLGGYTRAKKRINPIFNNLKMFV